MSPDLRCKEYFEGRMKPSLSAVHACLEKSNNFYLYDENIIYKKIEILRKYFPQITFLYSIKCNPNFNVLCSIFSHGFGADAASVGEVELAHRAGLPCENIYYSSPGKTFEDITSTLDRAILIADSLDEIRRIQQVAAKRNTIVPIGIRINPDFSFVGAGGTSSKFGIDEEQALSFFQKNECMNINVSGIHVHLKSQELKAETLAKYYKRMFTLAEKFQTVCGELSYINMGSGMGIPYEITDAPLNMEALASIVSEELDRYHVTHPNTKIMIEVGRYVVCESGVYVTPVVDRKVSYGKTYIILKNTLNGFIRPSLVQLISSYSTENAPVCSEPLFTSKNAFQFLSLKGGAANEIVTLVGNLCTATDVIAENIRLPHLEYGDIVIMTNAGSYAAALSPMQFSSQDKPKEFLFTKTGEVK